MKKYMTTIIALVVIAVVIGGYFILRSTGVFDGESADATHDPLDDIVTGSAFSFTDEEVTQVKRIECYSEDDISLVKEGGVWSCETYPELDVIPSYVTGIINIMRNTNGRVVYEGEVDAAKQNEYGFVDSEQTIKVTMRDGTSKRLIFGILNASQSSIYAWVEGDTRVFLFDVSFRRNLMLTKIMLISTDIFVFNDSGQINRINISKNGERMVELRGTLSTVQDETRTWTVNYPLSREGASSSVESLLTTLLALDIEDIIASAVDSEGLSAYGLSPAAYSVQIADVNQSYTLNIGSKTEDGSYYHAVIGNLSESDKHDVILISASSVNFLDETALSYMDKYVFMTMYTSLSTVEITINGETHMLTYIIGDDSEEFMIDGTNVIRGDNDYSSEFKKIGTAMYSLILTGLEDEPSTQGAVVCEIIYTQKDGTVTKVTCRERDTSTVYFYVNDEYIGGYGNRALIATDSYANVGIKYALDTLLELVGLK